jgi:iron complex outermembrane receptor protein
MLNNRQILCAAKSFNFSNQIEMQQLSILVLLSVLFHCNSLGQQGPARCSFKGSIRLEHDLSPVAGAQLFLSDYEPQRGKMDVNWSSGFTDGLGFFSMEIKGQSNFLRVVRIEGDTIDLTLQGIQCNEHRDLTIALDKTPLPGCTYAVGTVPYVLPEVILDAFSSAQTLSSIPSSVGLISQNILESNDQSSLLPSLNTVPGVTMESRGYGGSHRLNIRGSSLRSPFAVRNVKMYFDGIPLTSADGQTPLELIDASDISSLEVIKGPAGSMYGSGNGGVLLMKSVPIDSGVIRITTANQFASFDGFRNTNSAAIGLKGSQLRIAHNLQDYEGYREQEFNKKQQVSLLYKQQINTQQSLTLWGTYYNGNWGLPGALNTMQRDTMPQQAIPFAIINNTSLQRERLVGAINQSGRWGKLFSHQISLNYQQTDKKNPYGTSAFNSGFKNEGAQSITGRAVVNFAQRHKSIRINAAVGSEWQTETYSILEQTIESGNPADFKYYYDIGYRQAMVFAQSVMDWKDLVSITGGLSSADNEQYARGRNAQSFQFDTTGTWGRSILPRFAVSIQPFEGFHLHRSYSAGAANPTLFEMIDQENNAYNLQLSSERGTLHELGIKHHLQNLFIDYSIVAYRFEITDAILPYSLPTEAGDALQRYHNAGSTSQVGLEWSLKYERFGIAKNFDIALWSNGSRNNHRFDNYMVNNEILNGLRLPGVPLTQANTGMQLKYKRFQLSLVDYWMDKMPLNNLNTEWIPAYHLLNAFASYQFSILEELTCIVHAGINNLLNSSYSSYLNLNALSDRYYNPSAPVNYFFGLRLAYTRNAF